MFYEGIPEESQKDPEQSWIEYWFSRPGLEWMASYTMHGWTGNEYQTLKAMEPFLKDPSNGLAGFIRAGIIHLHGRDEDKNIIRYNTNLRRYGDSEVMRYFRNLPGKHWSLKDTRIRIEDAEEEGVGIIRLRSDLSAPIEQRPLNELGVIQPFLAIITYRTEENLGNPSMWRISGKKDTFKRIFHDFGLNNNIKYLLVDGGARTVDINSSEVWKPLPQQFQPAPSVNIISAPAASKKTGIPRPVAEGRGFDEQDWYNYAYVHGWGNVWFEMKDYEWLATKHPAGWGLRFLKDKREKGLDLAIKIMTHRLEAFKVLVKTKNSAMPFLLKHGLLHLYKDDEIEIRLSNLENQPFMGSVLGPVSDRKLVSKKKRKLTAMRIGGVGMLRLRSDFPRSQHNAIYNRDSLATPPALYVVRFRRRGGPFTSEVVIDDAADIIGRLQDLQETRDSYGGPKKPRGPKFLLSNGGKKIVFFYPRFPSAFVKFDEPTIF